YHPGRRPEELAAQPRPDHDHRQGPRRQGSEALDPGPDLDAGSAVHAHPGMIPMTLLTAIKDCLLRERTLGRRPPSAARRKRNRQRGVALVAVMLAIAIVLVFANEFGTSTSVDLMAAANYRDQMRAHFLARSAINLSELVIRVQQRLDNIKQLADLGIRV